MKWNEIKAERDADGNLTPLALAVDALEDNGCDCGTDEPGTCFACRCEAALRDLWERLVAAQGTAATGGGKRVDNVQAELAALRAHCPTILRALENASPDETPFAGIIYTEHGEPYPAWGISCVLRGPLQYVAPRLAWDPTHPAEIAYLEHSEDSGCTEVVAYQYLVSEEHLVPAPGEEAGGVH